MRLFFFLDQDVAADGKVHNRCSDVAHVGRIVHQRARLPRRQAIGGRVLWDDGPQPRVASPGVPQPEHHHEYSRGNGEWPIAAQEQRHFRRRARLADKALVPAHHHSQALAEGKRAAHAELHGVAGDLNIGVLLARAIGTGEARRAQAGDAGGEHDPRASRLDGEFPFVAGNVPVELVVVLEELEAVEHLVVQVHGAGGVSRAGHIDLEFAVVALAARLVLQRVVVFVRDADDVEQQRIVEALRRLVLDRDGAIDAVARCRKARSDHFGNVESAVRQDRRFDVEAFDDRLRRGRNRRGHKDRKQRRKPKHPSQSATQPHSSPHRAGLTRATERRRRS